MTPRQLYPPSIRFHGEPPHGSSLDGFGRLLAQFCHSPVFLHALGRVIFANVHKFHSPNAYAMSVVSPSLRHREKRRRGRKSKTPNNDDGLDQTSPRKRKVGDDDFLTEETKNNSGRNCRRHTSTGGLFGRAGAAAASSSIFYFPWTLLLSTEGNISFDQGDSAVLDDIQQHDRLPNDGKKNICLHYLLATGTNSTRRDIASFRHAWRYRIRLGTGSLVWDLCAASRPFVPKIYR
jgi:hypothetical protein